MKDTNENSFESMESFQKEMDGYLKEYEKLLSTKYIRGTASKHYCVI